MTDKKTVEAVGLAICKLDEHAGDFYAWADDKYIPQAQAAIQAYQEHATIDDLKFMAKRLGVVVVSEETFLQNWVDAFDASAEGWNGEYPMSPEQAVWKLTEAQKAMIKAAEG